MFALRAKEKLLALERKDREKKEKKVLDRKKELQKFHAGLSPGDPRLGVVKNPSSAAKRNAKYIGTFSVQQNDPKLERIKEIVTQQVSRIDFQQPPSLLPVALLVSVEGVKVLSEDGRRLIMAHALKRILFTMVNDKHTAFILVAKNPDSPPDLCHCHIFMAKSQTEASDINELVGKAFKLAFASKHQKKQKDKKQKKETGLTNSTPEPLSASAALSNSSVNKSGISNHNSPHIHDSLELKALEERQLKETIDRLDQELLKLNIENFDLESYFNAYERDKGSEQYLKALTTFETNRRVIHQKSIILERMHTQYRQLVSDNNENLAANRNTNNVLVPPPLPKKKSPRSRSPSPVHISSASDEQPPPPLPPKPYHSSSTLDDLPPPIPHKHTNNHTQSSSALDTQRVPKPYEKPISKYDRMLMTLTPMDAPVPPGYEVWEPEFLGQPNGNGDNSNDFVLKDAEWFQSGIPREIAEEILRQEGEGSFIVRSSQSNPGCYALSMKGPKGNILNFLIEEDSKGVYFQGDDALVFPSLVGLIVHHSVIPGILPCPLAVTKSNPLFSNEDNSSEEEEDPDYRTHSEILTLLN